MTISNTTQRSELIQGLRDLADFLETNPNIPIQLYSTERVSYHTSIETRDDASACAETNRVATLLGVTPAWNYNGTQYIATKRFGPIRYEAVAITAAHMAAYRAECTYSGAVTP